MLGKKLGKRAMVLGALAQSIPDIDFIAAFWNDTASNLLAHRGFTHSFLFDGLATFSFALIAEHFHKTHRVGFKKWLLFFAVQITIHLLLDSFNNYGMGLLEPFDHRRFSINAMFVADPLFSIWPAISFMALIKLKARIRQRRFWWRFTFIPCLLYLSFCVFNKININNDVKKYMANNKIGNDFITTPAPLNNLLWYVVIRSKEGYHVGFRSVFDGKKNMQLNYFARNDSLLQPVAHEEELQHLIRFSQGYYTVEKWSDTLVFNDLRFGQIIGWHDPKEKFVFHYFLKHPDETNRLVVQRGRFAKWNWQTTRSMFKKIVGE